MIPACPPSLASDQAAQQLASSAAGLLVWVGGNRQPLVPPTAPSSLQRCRQASSGRATACSRISSSQACPQQGWTAQPCPPGSPRCPTAAQPCPSGREKSTGRRRRRSPSCPGWTPSLGCQGQWRQPAWLRSQVRCWAVLQPVWGSPGRPALALLHPALRAAAHRGRQHPTARWPCAMQACPCSTRRGRARPMPARGCTPYLLWERSAAAAALPCPPPPPALHAPRQRGCHPPSPVPRPVPQARAFPC